MQPPNDTLIFFERRLHALKRDRAATIAGLVSEIGETDLTEFFDDLRADLKIHLGTRAENDASEGEAEDVIATCEAWVTNHLSNVADLATDIAMAIYLLGEEHTTNQLRLELLAG